MANDTSVGDYRGERILAYMAASSVGLSIASFVAVIIGTAAGVRDFGAFPWPVMLILPSIGLPLGLLLIIALIVTNGIRRSREAKDASN